MSQSKSSPDTVHPGHLPIRLIAAGTIGNVMEWYDFAIFGYFAASIGRHFFPSDDPTTSLIAAFGAFAAGFLMRPLGGAVFGHVGDRFGRRTALTLSVLAMAIPTFLIGLLPGHDVLGPAAAVVLVLLRMIQGLSVGGEYTTSIVFLVEGAGRKRQAFAGSWSGFGAVGGILLGSATGALLTVVLPAETVNHWAWRLPFIAGLFVGLAGLWVRQHVPELPFSERETAVKSPLMEAIRTEWRTIIRVALLNSINGVGFYIAFVYLVTYMQTVVGLTESLALEINTISMVALLVIIPFSGRLTDRVGFKPVMIAACTGLFALAWPLFWMLDHPAVAWDLAGQLGFSILIGLFAGALPVAMVKTTPPEVRCSVISIGYNLCVGILGGISPLVATWLIRETDDALAPAYYVMAAALISLVAAVLLPNNSLPNGESS